MYSCKFNENKKGVDVDDSNNDLIYWEVQLHESSV